MIVGVFVNLLVIIVDSIDSFWGANKWKGRWINSVWPLHMFCFLFFAFCSQQKQSAVRFHLSFIIGPKVKRTVMKQIAPLFAAMFTIFASLLIFQVFCSLVLICFITRLLMLLLPMCFITSNTDMMYIKLLNINDQVPQIICLFLLNLYWP